MTDPRPPVRLVAIDDLATGDPKRLAPPAWSARPGFDLPSTPWDLTERRWVCVGTIQDRDRANKAMEALTRGVGLVVAVTLRGDDRRRFDEDLARAGTLLAGDDDDAKMSLDHEQAALLEALAAGLTVTAAAERAHLSRRTANRRLSEARARLGVGSTAEAVTLWSTRQRRTDQYGS